MATDPLKPRPEETVRKIAELALGDAIEITVLTALIRQQNTSGVNNQLSVAGAGRAASAVKNALIARLVTLIARAYAEPKHGDLHLRAVVPLLKNNVTRQIFTTRDGVKEKVAEFEAHFAKCHGDHRQARIIHFRHKYTAHLGEPEDIATPAYTDIFAFGALTAECMELFALATGVAVKPISSDPTVVSCAEEFWKPWKEK